MGSRLPHLSRFETQILRRLLGLGQASVRHLHDALPDPPTYSTVRKIVERLEEKGAIERVRKEGKAWVYRPRTTPSSLIRREIRRFLDLLFDGSAAPLVRHLAEMDELSLEDLRGIEERVGLKRSKAGHGHPRSPGSRR